LSISLSIQWFAVRQLTANQIFNAKLDV